MIEAMLDAELGRVARAIRHRLKWRQEDVARRAGVHRSTVATSSEAEPAS